MRLLAILSVLIFPIFAFADPVSATSEVCREALYFHNAEDLINAELRMMRAKGNADVEGTRLPAWCNASYRVIRLKSFAIEQKAFEDGWRSDWNSSWNRIRYIEYTAEEFGIVLPAIFYAKRAVVKARNEEIRQRILAICAKSTCNVLPSGDEE